MITAEPETRWQSALDSHISELEHGNADFEDTLALIDHFFEYRPVPFQNGQLHNAAGTNEGSCKIFALSQIAGLDTQQTLLCFGRHYRSVLEQPSGREHANIRQFLENGGAGLRFEALPLQPKPASQLQAHMSEWLSELLEGNAMPDSVATNACFELKGAMLPMTLIELQLFEQQAFEDTLREKIRQAPGFFKDIPVIVSLEKYSRPAAELDFFQIIGICRRHNVHVVAVRGGDEDMRRLARNAALAWMPAGSARPVPAAPAAETPPTEDAPVETAIDAAPTMAPGKVVTLPVRSGQQVYAAEGDLIVLAPVSAGAEILAAGNIHVYGPLRGRALAGVQGDTNARVFCQSMEAELVSIAGHYKISEDLQESCWKQPAQVQLKDDVLVVTPLG
ncbi:septum site-determining protein MinC [Mangrovitalea sediminis]|uniref:septum site-determining protein MinC n=1 Tax=Mangrovitalea sediminis TaxID=1982043 RepID=UPI000BE5DE18|nr:septum site-determining protein MinC [Mangrovitalea sediminis]